MKLVLPAVLLGLSVAAPAVAAEPAESQEGLVWLKKMASASRQLNYAGSFVYRSSRQAENSRIAHFVNPAGGEFERLETLDGPPREVIRTNDQVTCYLPASKTVIVEKRNPRRFPALLPEQLTGVSDSYNIRKEGMDRVADHECYIIVLEPKDNLRYGHNFCAEAGSGLPLRARSYNEKKEPLESFAFTQITIGGNFNREMVKSRYAAKSKDWKVDRSGLPVAETPADTGWVLVSRLPGFKKLTEFKRSIAGRATPVAHIVFSDGLAAVSVFIEPMPNGRATQTLSHQGAVNIYTRPVAEYMVTALGEAPAATVMQIANSLELKGATATAR
ncbi:MAG TPA: MucB/RseB C-terminal domain-containing protein [Burkholderiales bacterium]|nr:MucB/RseB C-terminal domain-containing protein [Burkholderiales bacterium]